MYEEPKRRCWMATYEPRSLMSELTFIWALVGGLFQVIFIVARGDCDGHERLLGDSVEQA